MFKNLLAAIEAEINQVVEQQKSYPLDIQIATKKLLLTRLANEYINLEQRFVQVVELNVAR